MLVVEGSSPESDVPNDNESAGLRDSDLHSQRHIAQSELALEISKLSLDSLSGKGASQTRELLQRIVEIAPEVAREFLLGPDTGLSINRASHRLLRELVGRDYAHLRESIEFARQVFQCFQPLSRAERESQTLLPFDSSDRITNTDPPLKGNAKAIFEYVLTISDKTLSYSSELDNEPEIKRNLRHKRSEITLKVLRGEAQIAGLRKEAPGLMLDALGRMANTDQDLSYFEDFCRKARTWNPYHATQLMRPNLHRFAELPQGTQHEYEHAVRINGEPITTARGQSGTFLNEHGYLHTAYSSFADGKIFVCKREGMLSIFRNWRPNQDFQSASSRTRRLGREQSLKDSAQKVASGEPLVPKLESLVEILSGDHDFTSLAGVSLQDLQRNASYQELARKNPILARELALYKELQRANEQLKSMNYRLWRSVDSSQEVDRTHRLLADQGGRFLGWFARKIAAEKAGAEPLPDHIKYAYVSLIDSDFPLDPAREQFYLDALMAYQALKSNIDGTIAFAGLIKDAEYYEALRDEKGSLSKSHPFHSSSYQFNAFLGDRADKLRSNEISYPEFVEFVEGSNIKQWRSRVNAWLHSRYEPEFSQALNTLRSAFQIERANYDWRADSKGDCIPETRLKAHLWGSPIVLQGSSSKPRPALSHRDWKNLMMALTLEEYDRGTGHKALYEALPIKDFAEMLASVTLAAGKVGLLEANLQKKGFVIDAAFRENPPAELCDGVSGLTGGYSKSNYLRPANHFFDELSPLASPASTASQTLQKLLRIADVYYSNPEHSSDAGSEVWLKHRHKLLTAGQAGLVPGMPDGLERVFLEFTALKAREYHELDLRETDALYFADRLLKIIQTPLTLPSEILIGLQNAAAQGLLLQSIGQQQDAKSAILHSRDYKILMALWDKREELLSADLSEDQKIIIINKATEALTRTLALSGSKKVAGDFILTSRDAHSKPEPFINWVGELQGKPLLECSPQQIQREISKIKGIENSSQPELLQRLQILQRALRCSNESRVDFRQAEKRNFLTWLESEFGA